MATYADAAPEYFENGWHPLPLFGGKGRTPAGTTGYAGALVTEADITRWSKEPNVTGLCLRLVDMVGLDVDAYKANCKWDEVTAALGPLPPTWISSSRFGDDYDGLSGIRIYRLPAAYLARQSETCWLGGLGGSSGGIDIIRFGHRQVNAWPQVHPGRGATYQWFSEESGAFVEGPIPCRPEEIPELPEAWAAAMIKPEHPQTAKQTGHTKQPKAPASPRPAPTHATPEQRAEVEGWWTHGEPCPAVRRALDDILDSLPSSRHGTALNSQLRLTRLGEQGHQGVLEAIGDLRDAFIAEREGDEYLSEPPEDEWSRAEAGIFAQFAINGFTAPENVRCCGPVAVATADLVAAAASVEWPAVEPLTEGCAVPYPVDALPPAMAAAVEEVARSTNTEPSIAATAFLGVAAGLLGSWLTVEVTPTWRMPCNLYLAAVAGTGDGKTPASVPAREPLLQLEAQLREADQVEKRRAKVMMPGKKKSIDIHAKKKLDAAAEEVGIGLHAELEHYEAVLRRDARLCVDDTTPEQMAAIMADNGGRIIAFNDEGALFRHALGMYANDPNLDLWLKAYEGNPHTVDRKGGGGQGKTALYIPRPLLTLIALVQPTTIRRFGDQNKAELLERGALARVLISWPLSRVGDRMLPDVPPPPYVAVPAWNQHLLVMASDPSERTIGVAPEAWLAFTAWHNTIQKGLRLGGVYEDVQAFVPKITGSVLRLAALLADMEQSPTVTAVHMHRGIALGDFYLAHAQAVVESWAGGEIRTALAVLTKLAAGKHVGLPKCKDPDCPVGDGTAFHVQHAARWARVKQEVVLPSLEVLEEHGYIRPLDPAVGYGEPGRQVAKKAVHVLVNPALTG